MPMNEWNPWKERPRIERIESDGVEYKLGDRVRLRPLGDADIFDLALQGKTATIAAIEQDFEDQIQLAVTVDDDPGRDFGIDGKPAHRFFFRPEEIELLDVE
jgi:hypothetical protein